MSLPARSTPSGHYSPLRYPGGKGKLAKFVADVIRLNGLQDGMYVEPYAGGAAVALELIITGIVRRISINDLSKPIYEFWKAVLYSPDEFIQLVKDTPADMATRAKSKEILMDSASSGLPLAFATFFLNRTNRSGILNGGAIGGADQSGPWKLDARYNKEALIERIRRIQRVSSRIRLSNMDAVEFLEKESAEWPARTLIYLDPPYYEKGRDLYYNFYRHDDHANVAYATHKLTGVKWIVSYDDVTPIRDLYSEDTRLQYTIGYSARERSRGVEAMFFSPRLQIPEVTGSMVEIERTLVLES